MNVVHDSLLMISKMLASELIHHSYFNIEIFEYYNNIALEFVFGALNATTIVITLLN